MTYPLFLADFDQPGETLEVAGDEARHAVAVRRIQVGETVMIANGRGLAVQGPVESAEKQRLVVRVETTLEAPRKPRRIEVIQALPKGDRADLAVEILTEVGADVIVAWQAQRSIVKWTGERAAKSLAKWQATAREATKQSRRFFIPEVVHETTAQVAERLAAADVALVLHESAHTTLGAAQLPQQGTIALVVGPEGGIAPEELERFVGDGAVPVRISDGVLRTSTAGAIAVGQLEVL